MNEMLRYTIIRVILFVMGGFLVLGCSDEDDVGNSVEYFLHLSG